MFTFELTKEEEMVRDSARSFARSRLLPNMREHEARGIPQALADEYRGLGFLELESPDGLGPLAKILVLEELGAGDAAAALALDGWGPARYPVLEMAPESSPWRARAFSGERGSLLFEGAAQDGVAPWVPADRGTIVALGNDKASLHPAVTFKKSEQPLALEAAGSSEVALGSPAETWSGEAGARRALARARTYVAGLLVGIARAACEHAVRYAQERVTFGRPIAHHQVVAFMLVDMAIGVDAARLMTWRAAWAIDKKKDEERLAAEALAEACDQALAVTTNAVQTLGGHGFVRDHPVEKWYREARALSLLWGNRDSAQEDLGRLLQEAKAEQP